MHGCIFLVVFGVINEASCCTGAPIKDIPPVRPTIIYVVEKKMACGENQLHRGSLAGIMLAGRGTLVTNISTNGGIKVGEIMASYVRALLMGLVTDPS